MQLTFRTEVGASLQDVKSGFNRDLFLQLKPFFLQLKLDRFDGCERGHEVHLRTGLPGFLQPWVSRIVEDSISEKCWYFVDEGASLPFPLRSWKHRHEVRVTHQGTSEILDMIDYSSEIDYSISCFMRLCGLCSRAGRRSIGGCSDRRLSDWAIWISKFRRTDSRLFSWLFRNRFYRQKSNFFHSFQSGFEKHEVFSCRNGRSSLFFRF